jgi:hypothetical protein
MFPSVLRRGGGLTTGVIDFYWPEEGRLPGLTHTDLEQPTAVVEPTAKKRFCSRCGEPAMEPPVGDPPPAYEQRVCGVCGMGVLLRCGADALPGAKAAFAIVDRKHEIAALSETAETIFGPEEKLLGRSLLDMLTSPVGDRRLARAISQAALRMHEPLTMPARLSDAHADAVGTMACRISTCGPPRAALVVVEPTHFGRR